jgi:hypothetical protein
MKAALQKAKVLVGVSEDDALTRAALAVQYSDMGAARKIEQLIAFLAGKKIPPSSPLTADSVRAIVVREIGASVERDDPFLLTIVAMQEIELGALMAALAEFKEKHEATVYELRKQNEQIMKEAVFDVDSMLPESSFPVGTAIFFSTITAMLVTAMIYTFPGLLHLAHAY